MNILKEVRAIYGWCKSRPDLLSGAIEWSHPDYPELVIYATPDYDQAGYTPFEINTVEGMADPIFMGEFYTPTAFHYVKALKESIFRATICRPQIEIYKGFRLVPVFEYETGEADYQVYLLGSEEEGTVYAQTTADEIKNEIDWGHGK